MSVLGRLLLGGVVLSIVLVDRVAAQNVRYRIETDVFLEGVKEPLQQSLTLFAEGIGYDVSREDDGEFTMVDADRDRIILLNTKLKIRTEIKISAFESLVESAKSSPELAVYVQSAQQVEETEDKLRVGNDLLSYEATLQDPSDHDEAAAISESYRKFADSLILLNCARPGSPPPFARLALNQAIRSKEMLPKEIKKTAKRGKGFEVHRVLLHATWLLSKRDEDRIAQIGRMLTSPDYEDVGYGEYQRRAASLLANR